MTKILVDFSQIAISSIVVNAKELAGDNFENLSKHVMLNQLLGLRKRFGGELIVCCDAREYWRRDEFPYYKGHRKHSKDDSFLDWDLVYRVVNEMVDELEEFFPYKVIKVSGAEGDDIIATLTKYFNENELESSGLFESPQEVIIVSSDGDYTQLQKYRNVKQWVNSKKSFLTSENPHHDLIEYICVGQPKDNVPNIMTSDEWAKARTDGNSLRAKSFYKTRLVEFFERGYDACVNEEEQRNFKRNELLLDFDKIPQRVSDSIMKCYHEATPKGTKKKIWDYLASKRMKLLLASSTEF